jgi:hypothetical protein
MEFLKNHLQVREPRLRQIEDIKKAAMEEWDVITIEEIRKYVHRMPERIQDVATNHGGHTRW